MSTELDTPFTVVSPRTGEVLTLDAPLDDLGQWLDDVREVEGRIKDEKRAVQDELLRRFDKQALHTHHLAGGLKLSSPSPVPAVEYDALEMRTALLELVDADVLAIEAVDRAIEPITEYKPRKTGINALLKLGGRVAEIVREHTREIERARYVKVERS